VSVELSPLPAFSIGSDTGFCENDSVLLTVHYPNAQYLWSNGSTNDTIFVSEIGDYSLLISDSLSCKNYDTISIIEYSSPVFSIGNDTVICPETQIVLYSDVYGEFLWSDSTTQSNLTISQPGDYWLKLTDTNFCSSFDTISVFAKELPDVNLGNDTLLCNGEILTLFANPQNCSYIWTDGNTDSLLNVFSKGVYGLTATNICGSDSDFIFVDYEYCGNIVIPNIFTPNNDGINETFFIKGIENEIWELYVYNRWGQLLFYFADYKNDWTAGGVPDGTYYYILQNPNTNKIFNGTVRIYR